MDIAIRRSPHVRKAWSWERIMPVVRLAVVGGVLALAVISLMFATMGASVVPYWIQGAFALVGITTGAFVGAALRRTA
jgi:hypothetical protein